jgi:hypothetical protein
MALRKAVDGHAIELEGARLGFRGFLEGEPGGVLFQTASSRLGCLGDVELVLRQVPPSCLSSDRRVRFYTGWGLSYKDTNVSFHPSCETADTYHSRNISCS